MPLTKHRWKVKRGVFYPDTWIAARHTYYLGAWNTISESAPYNTWREAYDHAYSKAHGPCPTCGRK